MKKPPLSRSLLAALLAALIAPAIGGTINNVTPMSQAAAAPILYTHSTYKPDTTLESATLYRVDPATGAIARLTSQTDGVYHLGGSWSPGGTRIVYAREYQATHDQSQLYRIDAHGGSSFRLTSGLGKYQQPSWGPTSQIAFIDDAAKCLALVQYDGAGQHVLFCPSLMEGVRELTWTNPQWSLDGKTIYLQFQYYTGLDSPRYAFAYRVSASTGAATLLFKWQHDDVTRSLAISPNGKQGIYDSDGKMVRVNFETGAQTTLKVGTGTGEYIGQQYSPDGSHVAFVHNFEVPTPDHTSTIEYVGTYVMRVDGTGAQRISAERQSSADYKEFIEENVAGWSSDGSHFLINRTLYRHEQSGLVAYPSLRIVHPSTNTVTPLQNVMGSADSGSWFQH